jgi:SWI/SNF-related matrix-associated actin-dependent regulator of chromatin subfamily A containing DEAD/H box 1
MADSDPISDGTPRKRQKLDNGLSQGKAWDSQDDDGEDLTVEDYETVATLPLQRKTGPTYSAAAMHSDYQSATMGRSAYQQNTFGAPRTQSSQTQGTYVTQPTQPLPSKRITPPGSNVLVGRSSPSLPDTMSSSPKPPAVPQAPKRLPRPFAIGKKSGGLLGSALGPAGTSFRPPPRVQAKPAAIDLVDSDEDDPPVQHSSDDETQGLASNLKPTNFKKAPRGPNATPNRAVSTIKESPLPSSNPAWAPPAKPTTTFSSATTFSSLLSGFTHHPSAAPRQQAPRDDMASAYGSVSRPPKPQHQRTSSTTTSKATDQYRTLDDVTNPEMRNLISQMQKIMSHESVQRCHDALTRCRKDRMAALSWLADNEVKDPSDDVDELSSMSPPIKRGVAMSTSQSQRSSQPVRPAAKQEVKQTKSIAERYGATQIAQKPSQPVEISSEEEDIKPKKGRLLKGRPRRSPTPPSSPPQSPPPPMEQKQRPQQRRHIVIDDDDEEDSVVARDASEEIDTPVVASDIRLLKFFNECSARELADLSAQQEDIVQFIIEKRPFSSLDDVRTISNAGETKSGKKSKKRPIGEKILDDCTEMWQGYEAVDELVVECEKIAKPIQEALRGWGVGDGNGELQLMKLDEAHDSGIGTPLSSSPSDDSAPKKSKGRFLGQPKIMGEVELKDYQLVGLNWLNLLYTKGISCILADDMGLGKTCQVISFLAHLQTQNVDGVHLVIVPGSTLENWLREFQRFAPSMKIVAYYGKQSERPELQFQIEEGFATIDVIVTTYDMCVKPDDNRFLRRLKPAVCVYDEAHQLRNPKSQRYHELMRIEADFKVLLTGTPLQNNLQELVAILAFIMPGLFKEKKEKLDFIFKHKASTKDADHAALLSAQRIARARTMMTPFILRRKKAQVLDLPAKHSRVEWCDMTGTQAQHYYSLVTEAQQVLTEKATGGVRRKAKDTSNILMSLRQAAIHPLLARRIFTDKRIDKIASILLKDPDWAGNKPEMVVAYLKGESNTGQNLKGGDFALHRFCSQNPRLEKYVLKNEEWMDSGKVQKFKELVTAYVKNGDRALVFSQFTLLMDILEAVLETLDIKFMRLDGSTSMDVRQAMIDTFTNDATIPVFMLSTKAGGAGINLACANKVIIFDSGFNPQDDIQAENRAHRVGQTREVEVVRLTTRGTIEEQIYALGESKLALDERVAGEGAATAAEDAQAEKKGEQMVEKMFLDSLKTEKNEDKDVKPACEGDLKDMFKAGMERKGVKVVSKQAQF